MQMLRQHELHKGIKHMGGSILLFRNTTAQ